MNRIRTTRRAALSLAFLTCLSIAPAFADGGSQGSSGGTPPPPHGGTGKAATSAPASPVAELVNKIRALFGL